MDREVSLQDMLSHGAGMPRHDLSDIHRKGVVSEMVSQLLFCAYLMFEITITNIDFDVAVPSTLC